MSNQSQTSAKVLKTNRGFWKYLLFSILTLGIYPCYIIGAAKKELNLACKEDGKHTAGFWKFFFLSIITLTIYSWVWFIKTCNRMHNFLIAHGKRSRISGGGYFCWNTFGLLLIGLGPFIALTKFLHNWNDVNKIYNARFKEKSLPQAQQGQTVNLGGQTLTFYTGQGGVPSTQNQQVSQPVAYNYAPNAGPCRVIDAYKESERLYQVINEKNKASGFDRFQAVMLILAFIFVVLLIAIVAIAVIAPGLITQFIGIFQQASVVVPKVIAKVSLVGIAL